MGESVTYLKIYRVEDEPSLGCINRKEILRYAGAAQIKKTDDNMYVSDEEDMNLVMEECLKEVLPVLTYKVSYRYEDIHDGLPFDTYGSKNIRTNLEGCHAIVMFAATIGIGIDRLIAKYSRTSPVKALFMQAIGAERIEALCDLFNTEVSCGDIIRDICGSEGDYEDAADCRRMYTKPRFSPGYEDLPLAVQKQFCALLDCQRRLGVTLNESLLMSPSKSVTAFIGIGTGESVETPEHKCDMCTNTGCEFRKNE